MKLASEVPPMPDFKIEHPYYGTCPHCTTAKRVVKGGWLADHRTPEYAHGNAKVAYQCKGSGRRYAEYGERPQAWDFTAGEWHSLNIDIPVLISEDPQLDGPFPSWRAVEVFQTDLHVRLRRELVKERGGWWRIEVAAAADKVEGTLLRENIGWTPVASTEMSRDMLGMNRLVMWLLSKMEDELDTEAAVTAEARAESLASVRETQEGPF